MFTRCPNCKTWFRTTSGQISVADAQVRCGQCLVVFNARDSLQSTLPHQDKAAAKIDTPTDKQPAKESKGPNPISTQPHDIIDEPLFASRALDEDEGRHGIDAAFATLREGMPMQSFTLDENDTQHGRFHALITSVWLLAGLILLGGLILQYAYYQRDRLSMYAPLRPWLSTLCQYTDCQIPLQRELDKLHLTSRSVSSHPDIPNALIFSTTLVNNADFTQPFPRLSINMADARGKTVAQRLFEPYEYLSADNWKIGMTPGVPITIVLEVVDPGPNAQTFELDFL